MYDSDYDKEIESRWWNLMNQALEVNLCISIEKHISDKKFIVLLVKVMPIDKKPNVLFSKYDLEHSIELFFKCEKFIKNYKG